MSAKRSTVEAFRAARPFRQDRRRIADALLGNRHPAIPRLCAGSWPCRTTRWWPSSKLRSGASPVRPRIRPPPPARSASSPQSAGFQCSDRRFRLYDGKRQLYYRSWFCAPSGGSGRSGRQPRQAHPLSRVPHAVIIHPVSPIAPEGKTMGCRCRVSR